MTKTVEIYDAERAETLTRLILTRRKGVNVHILGHRGEGLDFIVSIKEAKNELIAAFGGIIVSTADYLPDEKAAERIVKGWKEPKHLRAHFPVVLFLFSTADDAGYFSWLLRPHEGQLEWVSSVEMRKITKKSLDSIFETAESWDKTLTDTLTRIPVR